MNEKVIRLIIIIITAVIHLAVIFLLVFESEIAIQEIPENAKIMKLLDLAELPPPPPPPPEEEIPKIPIVEQIAEIIIETDVAPVQIIVAAGSMTTAVVSLEDYLPVHLVSVRPNFDEETILSEIVYPPIALRSGIEGRVILDLFVDTEGVVRKASILREEPEDRGFGDAAVRVFENRRVTPAFANGEAVSCRFRYPVIFRIK